MWLKNAKEVSCYNKVKVVTKETKVLIPWPEANVAY